MPDLEVPDRDTHAPHRDGSGAHIVQLYEDDGHLSEVVGAFLGEGLEAGAAAVVIATPAHGRQLQAALVDRGLHVAAAIASGQLVFRDAEETLGTIMKGSSPDPDRFARVTRELLSAAARSAPRGMPRVFGEMVDLLCAAGDAESALQLEAMWNDLAKERSFALLCAYHTARFPRADDTERFRAVCGAHDRAVPALPRTALEGDRAALLRTITELQQQASALREEMAARRAAEGALAKRTRELADLVDNAVVGLRRVDHDGTIQWANRTELAMLGYAPHEYIGRPISDFHADAGACEEILATLREGGTLVDRPARMRRKDGSLRDVLIDANALFEDGVFLYSRWFTRDVTVLKAAQDSGSLLAAIVESSDDAIVSKSLDGTILSWNAGAQSILGYTPGEAVGRSIRLIVPPELHHEEQAILDRLQRGERIVHYETVRIAKDGRRIDISLAISPVRNARGHIVAASKVARDITARKRADLALRESQERYRRLTELLPVAVYTCEAPSGVITYHNAHAARLWGRSPDVGDANERFCGSLRMFLPDGTHLPHEACPMAVALREGRSFRNHEVTLLRPDGSLIHAMVNIDPIHDANGRLVGAINAFLDVSALKHAEQALRAQTRSLQTLLDTLPIAVFFADDTECRRISGNRAAAAMLGLPEGANFSKSAPPGESPTHFRVMRDGTELPAEGLPVHRAAHGEAVRNEEVEHVFDDGTVIHALVSAQPLYDDAGRPRGAIASMLDITTLRSTETRLREADRRKDEFLATLSHELRNPLAPLRNAMAILPETLADRDRFEAVRQMMERQLTQLVRLVDDLLDVSRISRGKVRLTKERLELAPVIRQAIEAARPLAAAKQQAVDLEVPDAPILVDADPVRLAQVFGNLLDNACKYTPPGGEIRVTVALSADQVAVSVKDTGRGISPEELHEIFEIFTQLDGSAQSAAGLGIGLFLAKHLVELHGGAIAARSLGAGCGSEFIVSLSIATTRRKRAPADGTAVRPRSSVGRRILVVDDNIDAAESLAMLLEMGGHQSQAAHDGHRALEEAASFRPELILLDIGLPGLDGYEVCRLIREQPWGTDPVIIAVTGWGQAKDRRRSSEAGFDAHLVKPIDPRALPQIIDTYATGRPDEAHPV